MSNTPTLGFIGLGVMGGPMCRNVVAKHKAPVWAFDMSESALDEVVAAGARRASSVAEVAAHTDVVFLSLPGGKQVEAVCLGEGGLASSAKTGLTIVDLSTTGVAEARDIAARLAEQGIQFIDAPVARTRQAAIDGTLSIMVGASPEQFAQVEPLIAYMASDITLCGDVGCGQVVKLVNNTLNFVHVLILAEQMVSAERAGVAPQTLLEAVSKGSGDSFILRNHGMKSMAPRLFPEKSFPPEYVLKDIGYSIELAKSMGVDPQVSELAERYYQAAVEHGYGGRYFPVVIEMIDKGQMP
jgi:3-hydroxyisobutyrate dehydrogenase-like beta-hydroxyacid dehydrogenase